MSAPRIFIRSGLTGLAHATTWEWTCTRCKPAPGTYGYEWTVAKAADAGREHMRRFHGYSRRCGASLAACEAQTCQCDKSHVGGEIGPENAIQRFAADVQPAINAAIDRMNDAMNRYATHDNPLQTAHNLSREDC